jgi:thiol-disulfide isomerase/thioredoxin
MNQTLKRQLKISAQLMSHPTMIIFGLLLTTCISLSRPLAATKPGKCDVAFRTLKGFQATTTTESTTGQPFINLQGVQKTLADYLGQGIVLNLWATWCVPCVKEMPQLDRLKKKISVDEIEVLAISVDRAGTPIVKRFFHLNGISNLDVLADRSGEILQETKTRGLPTTLLINAKGFEIGRVQGILEWDAPKVVKILRECLAP